MTTGFDLEHDLSAACDLAFAGLRLDHERIQRAVTGGRRRRRARVVARSGGTAGVAVIVAVGTLSLSALRTGASRSALLSPSASSAPSTGVDIDGVTVGVLPAGYRLAGRVPATTEPGLPCLSSAGADFLPSATPTPPSFVGAEHLLQVTVVRGPVSLEDPAGGPAFGPTHLGELVVSPYNGPGTRRGTFTVLSTRLGNDLVVTVQGTDTDAATIQAVVAGLTAGPADETPVAADQPAVPSPGVHAARC